MGGAPKASAVIPLRELSAGDLAAWRELADRAAEPNPFFEPEFVLPAARHLGESGIGLLVAKDRHRNWVGCMPVCPRVRVKHARVPGLSTFAPRYCYLGTPLVDASAVQHGTERLLEHALRASHHGVLVLRTVGEDGPVLSGLTSALELSGHHVALHRAHVRPVLHRARLHDGCERLISSRHRRDLRRLSRRLQETLDAPLIVRDESESAAEVERFMALEASGWKGERGSAMLARPRWAGFFRQLCENFRAVGRLQLLALGSEERAVSYKCNLLTADGVFCFKIAFDESLSHYRPGLQLELRMLEIFRNEMRQMWLDSCADLGSAMLEHLWPERRTIGSSVLSDSRAVVWTIEHGAAMFAGREGA
jgi:CelD/BcsL family acetyltransferase involved in cellulose biosynthesis